MFYTRSKAFYLVKISYLFEKHTIWINIFSVLKEICTLYLCFAFQVSSGAIDLAKTNIESMLRLCAKEIPDATDDVLLAQKKSLHDVTHELVKQVTSPNTMVREQVNIYVSFTLLLFWRIALILCVCVCIFLQGVQNFIKLTRRPIYLFIFFKIKSTNQFWSSLIS